mgnify:CR=1 FL=1|jgi:hypothetical protein
MKLTPLMTMHADLKDPVSVGNGPHGDRAIYDVTGGYFEGERLKGILLASGGDWITMDSEGVGHLDVRATFLTDDGAHIYAQYYGALVFNEKVAAAQETGIPAEFGDTHFVTQPRFETGDDRYLWLNSVMAIAEGRVMGNAVEYRIFEATAD